MKLFATLLLVCVFLFAQATQQPKLSLPAGAVLVDGSVNPAAIPDVLALRMYFGVFGQPAQAQASSANSSNPAFTLTGKQKAKLGRLKLPPGDTAVLLAHVASWYGELQAATSLDSITAPHLTALQAQMSDASWQAFYRALQAEKAHIKVIAYPAMPMH